MSRATTAAVEARTAAVVRLLLSGGTRSDVIAHAADHWGLSSRQVDRLLAAARLQIKSDWDRERPPLSSDTLMRLMERHSALIRLHSGC